jgi:hypothetical protein
MSLDFDVTKVKDHDRVTTAYRGPNGHLYTEAIKAGNDDYYIIDEESQKSITVMRIWHPVTEAIVFRCMGVGMSGIKNDDDVAEFYARSMWFDLLTQTHPLIMNGKHVHLSLEQLHDHIGITTNVGPETRAQWLKRMEKYDFDSLVKRAKKELAEEYATA